MELVVTTLVGLVAVAVGVGAGIQMSRRNVLGGLAAAESRATEVLGDAETKRKELLLEAKEEAVKLRSAAEEDARQQRNEIKSDQARLRQKEEALDRKTESVEQRERRLAGREQEVDARGKEIEDLRSQQAKELERVSQLTRDEARAVILGRVENEAREEAGRRARYVLQQAKLEADEEARRVITLAVQRLAGDHVSETTISTVPIPSEDMKGRIIGREGRNIRALEAATGVDIIVDETPDAVMLSGFDPVRREVARIALTKLVQDGRIHPTRVEEVVAKAQVEVEEGIFKAGEEAALEAGVTGLHPEVTKLLGRMKYRTSYGQNQLRHSVEASHIGRMLAHELGADPEVCARGALLHDLGKVMGQEVEGPHHIIGADFVRQFGESQKVADAIKEHHDSDPEMSSIEAVIVQVSDAISGARPGARHESVEHYIHRLEALEQTANSFDGVERSFAIQAGREVRVIVQPEEIDDLGSIRLARDLAKKIEETLQYPGQVRVTVVRETRAVDIAR
ncbi:MAG: ribonuclease Y [Chloroflexi bacterium]|nr:ribonuclease Y [Chloroflexota bacterium]